MSDRDKFDEMADRLCDSWGAVGDDIAAALSQADRAAREECAKIAENWLPGSTRSSGYHIAAAIRATIGGK